MTFWRAEWSGIAARIDGLVESSRFLMQGGANGPDPHACVHRFIIPEAGNLIVALTQFFDRHQEQLPAQARDVAEQFLPEAREMILEDTIGAQDLGLIVGWNLFRSRFEHAIQDIEHAIVSRTERAFEHLQRLIVADDLVRARWQEAFSRGEELCQRLGGAHLLHHGIYGFTTRGVGTAKGAAEATDLVFSEPVSDLPRLARISEGFVLTEWKVARTTAEMNRRSAEAIEQAELYRAGVLGGLEVMRTRYVVVVTTDVRNDHLVNRRSSCLYRRVVLSVNPTVPSRAARKRRRVMER